MASVYHVFGFLLFLVSAAGYADGKKHDDKCPESFDCGHLGSISFPFTKFELQHCGFFSIRGCDDADPNSNKTIQLDKNNGKPILIKKIIQNQNNIIKVFVEDQSDQFLKYTTSCEVSQNHSTAFTDDPNSPFPPYFHMKPTDNIILFRCDMELDMIRPDVCGRDYDNYCHGGPQLPPPPPPPPHPDRPPCSTLRLPCEQMNSIPDFGFSCVEIDIEFSLDCSQCNLNGGQCIFDNNNNFYCHTAFFSEAFHKLLHIYTIAYSCDFWHKHDLFSLSSQAAENKNRWLKLGFGLGFGGLLIVLIVCLIIIWRLRKQRYKLKHDASSTCVQSQSAENKDGHTDLESGMAYFGIPLFSYEELENATNNFDHSKELGSGGFGTVYHGKLGDGREVAVKRLYDHNYKRIEQFMNEVNILTRLRHRNLVSLYGCTSRHCRELLLVYEYIPNGTLSCHLHGDGDDDEPANNHPASYSSLPWATRMKIAIETATALAYLHASDTIHRDVKTNNILLDSNFCVKVADFGLSRLFPNDVTHVSTAPQGTPGYVDPEYYHCYQLTSKSDVYSFGVVLIELISSLPAVDIRRNKDEINLANLAVKKIQKSAFGELVDSSLGFESDSEVRRMIVSVAELAFQCLQRDKDLRPSMDEVLEILRRIESGKQEENEVDEVDIHGVNGILYSGPILAPSSPD